MNENLNYFLTADNLDGLQHARRELNDLDEKDIDLISSILNKWEDSHAVSNILIYPSLLPQDIRLNAILKALGNQQNPYITLAATLGLEDLNPSSFSEEERKMVTISVLKIIEQNDKIIADRASLSILPFLKKENIKWVIKLLSTMSDTIFHNLLTWLYNSVAHSNYTELREILEKENTPKEVKLKINRILEKDEQGVARGLPSLISLPLYSYIPDRNEI